MTLEQLIENLNKGRGARKIALYREGWLDAISDPATAGRELIIRMSDEASRVQQDKEHEWRRNAPGTTTTINMVFGEDGDIDGTQLVVNGIVRMECRVIPDSGLTDDEIAQYAKSCTRRTMLKDENDVVLSFDQLCSATENNLVYMLEGEIDEMHFWWDNNAQTLKTKIVGFGETQNGTLTLADEGEIDV